MTCLKCTRFPGYLLAIRLFYAIKACAPSGPCGPMLGFKDFDRAVITITGIELPHRIREGSVCLGVYVFKAKLRLPSGMQMAGLSPI